MTEQDIMIAIDNLQAAYTEQIKNDYAFFGLKEECELIREMCPGIKCYELPKNFISTEMKGCVYYISAEPKPIKVYME